MLKLFFFNLLAATSNPHRVLSVKNVKHPQRISLMLHNRPFNVISHVFNCPVCPLQSCCCCSSILAFFCPGIRLFRALSLIIKLMFATSGKQKHTFRSLYGTAEGFFTVFTCVDPRPSLFSIDSPGNAAFDKSLPLMRLLSDASGDPNQRASMGPGLVCPAHSWQTDNSLFALLVFVIAGKPFQACVSSAPATFSCHLRVSGKS